MTTTKQASCLYDQDHQSANNNDTLEEKEIPSELHRKDRKNPENEALYTYKYTSRSLFRFAHFSVQGTLDIRALFHTPLCCSHGLRQAKTSWISSRRANMMTVRRIPRPFNSEVRGFGSIRWRYYSAHVSKDTSGQCLTGGPRPFFSKERKRASKLSLILDPTKTNGQISILSISQLLT